MVDGLHKNENLDGAETTHSLSNAFDNVELVGCPTYLLMFSHSLALWLLCRLCFEPGVIWSISHNMCLSLILMGECMFTSYMDDRPYQNPREESRAKLVVET